ncbi:tRNA (adenine(58)-N(1))-methyltransferase, mitochondrial isoform X1 [Nothobranchius furzeri]|uniref:tRNA (adenine(58)-N(1))-methyltransferase n=1 Tax=Nothobranchius furzeri TaxID=105023 RepID=A0A1A8A993_NOTFU|nr:tRNA (adenine(58)-N(1))-methyltransferase, mitochondrial isoform X1 [Nothobranchius furzeri]
MAALLHRLLTAFCQTHDRKILVKLTKRTHFRSSPSTSVRSGDQDGCDAHQQTSGQALLSRRRRWLSPLDRISSLLPPDVLGPEVMQLRQEQDGEATIHQEPDEEHLEETKAPSSQEKGQRSPTLPGESVLTFGELLMAEHRKKQVHFRKMFQLQSGARLQSSWGVIPHNELAGRPAGRFLKTNTGVPIFFHRPSLEDYVLNMKRGPVIAYPKDAAAMLLMMDVTEGDCVLESGSGSGALALFLSRAVGSRGSVLSVELREDHHTRAVLNYERWRTSWALRRGHEWPDNVDFHISDLCSASALLAGRGFHSVALDLINPHLVLATVLPHLLPGGVCAVYLAKSADFSPPACCSVTQVIDLLEGLRCAALPLLCERIVEVPVRDWVVAPALQKDRHFCTRKAPDPDGNLRQEAKALDQADSDDDDLSPAFGSVPYIARPHPEQMSHTAFLVKLRKCVR